jgi:hypothetical protein
MLRKGQKVTRDAHAKCHTIMCDWCGERREVSRTDAKTCGPKCRMRMSNYVRRMGYRPDGIVGPFTTQDAIAKEIDRLILQEQRRRRDAKAYLDATGKLPPRA